MAWLFEPNFRIIRMLVTVRKLIVVRLLCPLFLGSPELLSNFVSLCDVVDVPLMCVT